MNRGRVFVAATLLLFGLGIATAIGRAYLTQRRAATTFVPTRAIILSSALSGPRTPQKDTTYTLKIRYWYNAGASVDTSTSFSYEGVSYATLGEANAALGRYPEGGQVTAYYDPKRPTRAVLDRTPPTLGWGVLFLGVYLAISIYMLQSGIRGQTGVFARNE